MTVRGKIMCIVGGVSLAGYVILAVIFGFLVKGNLEDIAKRQTAESAWLLQQQLVRLLDLGIPIDQILGFEEQCRALLQRNDNLAFAYVADVSGVILFHSEPSLIGAQARPPEAPAATGREATRKRMVEGTKVIETELAVRPGHASAGTIRVGIEYQTVVRELLGSFLIPAGAFVILLVASLALTYWLFETYVGTRLSRLATGINAFGENPDGPAPEIEMPSVDEFGTIATSFNKMAKNVSGNIERRKRAEADLLDLNRDLERRVEERTYELTENAFAALEASRAKSAFLSHMSHELRTPLNSIIGYAEAMQYKLKGDLPPAYEEYAGIIVKSGNLLLETVNTVLDLAKVEAGRLELDIKPTPVGRIVGEALGFLDIQARDKNIALIDGTTILPVLDADDLRLQQAFINVVGNAIKFTDSGSVTITDSYDRGSGYRLVVEDTGIGMSEEELETALEPFAQVHSTTLSRKYQGTGLGLPFAREIMRLHGGSLDIESETGVGTTVTLRFPPEICDAWLQGLGGKTDLLEAC